MQRYSKILRFTCYIIYDFSSQYVNAVSEGHIDLSYFASFLIALCVDGNACCNWTEVEGLAKSLAEKQPQSRGLVLLLMLEDENLPQPPNVVLVNTVAGNVVGLRMAY